MGKDRLIYIATAKRHNAVRWLVEKIYFSELMRRCSTTKRTSETVAQYNSMSREQRGEIKDVGGFVGGSLRDGKRTKDNVSAKGIIQIDVDNAPVGTMANIADFDCPYLGFIYTTHSHQPETGKERFRLVLLFDRDTSPTEWSAVMRKICKDMGILEYVDHTSFDVVHLFYWPSTSKDGEFVFLAIEGEPVPVDEILASMTDWLNPATWPRCPGERKLSPNSLTPDGEMARQGDPLTKPGMIGLFNRRYSISQAIDTFLPDVYRKCRVQGRYTYTGASTTGGLVVYEDKWAYSHHATDPASERLCNAFDLVRIHKFGDLDRKDYDDITKAPSYRRMEELVDGDPGVKAMLLQEIHDSASRDFGDIEIPKETKDGKTKMPDRKTATAVATKKEVPEWMDLLETDKGRVKPTGDNIEIILEHDPFFAGKLWHNLFSGMNMVSGPMPWETDPEGGTRTWRNVDESGVRRYLETHYGITRKQDLIKDCLAMVFQRHGKHPIRERFRALVWDGTERAEKVFIDCLGADDTPVVRAMTRKWLLAGVKRVFQPGCKFDYIVTLVGPQGIGKSKLAYALAFHGEYFSDSIVTMEGKQAMEQLRGVWIAELGELAGMKKSDVETIKAFISKQKDVYRPAYGTVNEEYPRQTTFMATTNDPYFLKDRTGNRRFWTIRCDGEGPLDVKDLDVEQVWAEVYNWYVRGEEELFLSPEMEREASDLREQFDLNTIDPMYGQVEDFLYMDLPMGWPNMGLQARRDFVRNRDKNYWGMEQAFRRSEVSAIEVACECMGYEPKDPNLVYVCKRIVEIFKKLGWEHHGEYRTPKANSVDGKTGRNLYGRQKTYFPTEKSATDGATEPCNGTGNTPLQQGNSSLHSHNGDYPISYGNPFDDDEL